MGVDISTWRARVGMFTQRTSQQSLLIFRAQNRNQHSNHHQAPWLIAKYFIPGPVTDKELGSIQQDDYKSNQAQPAYEENSHVAWVLFPFIVLFFVLLVDTQSQPRPPPSCPPPLIYPDQNETSPMQLSDVQLVLILMCGDVEVNPGPPSRQSFADRATELTKFTVPVEDVSYPEYCCNLKVDFKLRKKMMSKTEYDKLMDDIVVIVCAMLNYAGGVITLHHSNQQLAHTPKDLDEWAAKIQQHLDLVEYIREVSMWCIQVLIQPKTFPGHIEIWVRKSWKMISYKALYFIRKGSETMDGDISKIQSFFYTKPKPVSLLGEIQWFELNHGDQFSLSEGRNLEFKCYEHTSGAETLITKIKTDRKRYEPVLIRTLLAFTNTEGGGDAIIGVKEDADGAPILKGQELSVPDEEILKRHFDELMIKGINGEQRIWPSTTNGSKWTINFYPLKNCPSNTRRVLIHIRVNQVAGCVLADEPEAYTMTPEGNIRHVPLNEWKNCIQPTSNESASNLLKLSTQPEEQGDDDIDEELPEQLVNDLKEHRVTFSGKHVKSAIWTKDSEDSQDEIVTKPGVNMHTCVEQVSKSELLMPSCPTTWVPDKPILDRWVANNHPAIKECVDDVNQSLSQPHVKAVVIGTRSFAHLFPRLSLEVPQHHAFDFFVLQGNARIDLRIVFDDCRDFATCKKYTNSAIRKLRSQLLGYMHQHTDTKAAKLVIRAQAWSIADSCIMFETVSDYTESTVELPVLQKAVAYCLLQGQSHIRNRLGEEYLTALTKDQLSGLLLYPYMNVIVFQGPPGSGKSIIAQHLCEKEVQDRNLSKNQILYICPCQPLAEFMKFQGKCEVKFTTSKRLVNTISEALKRGILLIIVDDAHLFKCSKPQWFNLLKQFSQINKRHLVLFLDPEFQNFKGDKAKNLFMAILDFNMVHPFVNVEIRRALPTMIRNSVNIFTFFKTNAEEGSSALACSHDFQGDGVSVSYTSENFFRQDRNNPVIKTTKEIVGQYNFEESFTYKETDITILVDSNGRGKAGKGVKKLHKIFHKFYSEAKVQRASQFPVQGIVIEELISFSGLDTRICILVLTSKNTSVMDNPRYKCFVASRGITKLVFLLHGDTVDSSLRQLKFSEEKQWQKLTSQLLKEIPEKGSDEWLRTNVPDTECWHKTKPFVIVRCQQQIQSKFPHELAEWVDSNITPALRHDAQFVRAVIGSVCKRTIGLGDHSVQLRGYLGILNCLYGAPESLQHQALDSVHDLVESQHHPENVLNKILNIMWHDGYISRQVIRSWFDNKRKTCEIGIQGKDLGEQIQERMRARKEVWGWMMGITQLGSQWYDSPHYQRVVLHALCQLAVTWQGDRCTVDKSLLFHYIPQLYCYTTDGLQLLYAVQCVLHHLQNPPGLAVAVLQALLTIIRPHTTGKPVITTSDWDTWRNTQNPLYEEGRNIIQQQGRLLDLIVLINSGQTSTEINGWISANIQQAKIQDAFILTAACLINRGEEVQLIWDWISQIVPQSTQTLVQDAMQTLIIQKIPSRPDSGLIFWMDEHILPAWRQDAQFVRAAVNSVCERIMHSHEKIDYKELRHYLGSLNCLYGAPEALQLQALESVYDHVRSLQHAEKALEEVLDVMLHDGYISRQVIVSWLHDMDETSAIMPKRILMHSKRELGKRIQERMRARQEVRRWMGIITPSCYFWNDSPHYQRVALHALCQLAVTWQGDKCTVDRDLLFHYMPQIFCGTSVGSQLLYAVQCVLHRIHNPPGLPVAVLQALLTISSPHTDREDKPLITTTALDRWRNTQNPLYEEGRNIIQQQEKLLDLIVVISRRQTLTEINGWISANIQQDQIQDAFIITAVCLIQRGEEMTLIWDWISQNVPQSMQTVVQDTVQTTIIQKIPSLAEYEVVSRMERLILSAWRRDVQFVRAAIKAVCQRTIHLNGRKEFRRYIGALNCLYGAPEVLQLQALESVYDHVTTLQHPEKVLQDVLDIMWSDGYINRQVIVSWLHNMEETSAIRPKRILIDSKKDLGEQIQERMRARQEVREWMGDTTQLGYYWDDFPHYQRVALHALCQLAVTWQGNKCTMDRDLIFHYIPVLFLAVKEKIQLLYAVQCVVYQLSNPPGLAESVLKALVSCIPPRTKSIITKSHLEEWRKTKPPVYEEGREIMLQATKHIHI